MRNSNQHLPGQRPEKLRTPERPEILCQVMALAGGMRNSNQHLPGQRPEKLRTPERPEILCRVMALAGGMRNSNQKGSVTMASALAQDKMYTIDDIYALPDRQRPELIDGQIYFMAPPTRLH